MNSCFSKSKVEWTSETAFRKFSVILLIFFNLQASRRWMQNLTALVPFWYVVKLFDNCAHSIIDCWIESRSYCNLSPTPHFYRDFHTFSIPRTLYFTIISSVGTPSDLGDKTKIVNSALNETSQANVLLWCIVAIQKNLLQTKT